MNFSELLTTVRAMQNKRMSDSKTNLALAGAWLLEAQQASGGNGYAHSYHLLRGWQPAYPETTGYIIPSLLRLATELNVPRYRDSVLTAGKWLLSIQNKNGSFNGIDGNPYVFDTAQIVYGLLALYTETNEARWLVAAIKAGEWLVSVQEKDGSWFRYAYNQIPHTYYSRVGSILIELGKIAKKTEFEVAGKRNLEWTLSQQGADGYFAYMRFDPATPPYLHTIVYVLEGLLHGNILTKDKRLFAAVLKSANALLTVQRDNGILYSQYAEGWKPTSKEKCMTGLAQWAGLCFQLGKITGDDKWLVEAHRTLDYVKSKQLTTGSKSVLGAIPSSIPIWGSYGRFAFFNWNSKFFIDALLLSESVSQSNKNK